MDRIRLKNVSQVTLAGKGPGAVFRVDAKDGQPIEAYWRSRIAEKAVEIFTGPAVPTAVPDAAPPAAPVSRARSPKKDKDAD